ncbi:MgtC/SapB family protein [Lihuaxuella thermophila]|uniref:Putative Mg2+ transporter-C (MgtC) family protein n=1 Tax=Lihuaxuella thermophila TaxID=1173111 RepID=A0A1H8HTW2_9BACL|nr:MgtC/SapB family protein [Lihuaxuella thermophila]SEN59554.1 putative Mg2+ transporter-C (MgtC) family protein [Lihuaxuella thermophila]
MENVWTITYWEIALRLFAAGFLGGLIGWEREKDNHPAGFRTHILVSLGSALIMLISIYGFSDFVNEKNVRMDPARIAAQVVSGIGFLGAGTILRHGVSVKGLTTAASLWVVAGIGLAAGAGFMFAAVLATIFVLVSLELLNRLENILIKKRHVHVLYMILSDEPGKLGELTLLIEKMGGSIRRVNFEESESDSNQVALTFHIRLTEKTSIAELCEEISKIQGIKSVRTE